MLTVPAVAVEEHEVVDELTVHAFDHAIEQADRSARAAFAHGIQLSHFYTAQASLRRPWRSTTNVTNDSSHARSLDF